MIIGLMSEVQIADDRWLHDFSWHIFELQDWDIRSLPAKDPFSIQAPIPDTSVLRFEDSQGTKMQNLLAVSGVLIQVLPMHGSSQVVVVVAYGISTACLVSALYLQAITWILGLEIWGSGCNMLVVWNMAVAWLMMVSTMVNYG